jgi:hypothetical protein
MGQAHHQLGWTDVDNHFSLQSIDNLNTVIPPSATGNTGDSMGKMELALFGTKGSITETALSASCDLGTVTVTGAAVGHPFAVWGTIGPDAGGAFNLRGSVTAINKVGDQQGDGVHLRDRDTPKFGL